MLMESPIAAYQQPGPDVRQQPLSELVDSILASVGADRQITPDEVQEIQRLMTGLQMIAQQRAPQPDPAAAPPSNETEEYGSTPGAEPLNPDEETY